MEYAYVMIGAFLLVTLYALVRFKRPAKKKAITPSKPPAPSTGGGSNVKPDKLRND